MKIFKTVSRNLILKCFPSSSCVTPNSDIGFCFPPHQPLSNMQTAQTLDMYIVSSCQFCYFCNFSHNKAPSDWRQAGFLYRGAGFLSHSNRKSWSEVTLWCTCFGDLKKHFFFFFVNEMWIINSNISVHWKVHLLSFLVRSFLRAESEESHVGSCQVSVFQGSVHFRQQFKKSH